MASGIEFDSDLRGSGFQDGRPGSASGMGIAGWMVRKGLAGSEKQAERILIAVIAVGAILIAGEWLLFGGNGSSKAAAKYDPVAATRKAAAEFGKPSPF